MSGMHFEPLPRTERGVLQRSVQRPHNVHCRRSIGLVRAVSVLIVCVDLPSHECLSNIVQERRAEATLPRLLQGLEAERCP